MSRVVVVGGGAGGLAVAARLAVRRHDVTLLEQAPTTGGKLATYRQDGFAFDTGPSLLTLPAVYRDLFLKTGGPLEEAVDLQPVEPGFAYWFADGSTVTVPGVDPARAAAAFGAALGGTAERDWRRVIERGGRMWQLTREPFLQRPLDGWRTLLGLARSTDDVRTIAPWMSLRDLGTDLVADPRLRQVLDRYATYTGSDPRRAPAALATIPYMEQTFGVWHIGGGLGGLADALTARCVERGVRVRTGCEVTRVVMQSGRAAGVQLADGEILPADIVVSDADARELYGRLVDAAPARRARRALARSTSSLSGFVILLAVRGRTAGLAHHNVWFPADYDAEFDAVFARAARPVDDPAVYACVPDDPRMRPDDDHESWFILVNAPRHGQGAGAIDWDAPGLADRYADRVLDVLATRGTDLRDRVLWRRVHSPADLERSTRAPGGAIYGPSSNGARAAFRRPANASPVPGLYLVGGSAHPGGGLPLVGLGAEIVADLVGRA